VSAASNGKGAERTKWTKWTIGSSAVDFRQLPPKTSDSVSVRETEEMMDVTTSLADLERIDSLILQLRGMRVIIDADLARLYGVPTKALNQAIRRNASRFPPDFSFQLDEAEKRELVTNCDRFKTL
jgi:hypothetical protein